VIVNTTGGNGTTNNSGTNTGNSDTITGGTGTTINSGRVGGYLNVNAGSDALLNNSGSIGNFAQAHTRDGGNTTLINSGSISAFGYAFTQNGGNTSFTNSGSIGEYGYVYTHSGGDVTFNNSGSIGRYGYTFTQGGVGNITYTNSGSIGEYAFAYTQAGGNIAFTNSGRIGEYAYASTQAGGNTAFTNSGSIGEYVNASTEHGGNTTVINSGRVGQDVTAYTRLGGNTTLTNSGSINGGAIAYTLAGGTTVVTNSGSSQYVYAYTFSGGDVTLINSGTIGKFAYVFTLGSDNPTIINSGTVKEGVQLATFARGNTTLTNSGVITGGLNPAISFAGGPDTLNLLPGSFIVGGIQLVGTSDTVNVRAVNLNLTFNTLAGATVTGTVPFVVSGNRIASVDPTPFGPVDKNLMDFTRAISGMLEGRLGEAASGGSATAFASSGSSASQFEDAFAHFPGNAYAADNPLMFKNPTMTTPDGYGVWAKGFYGQRNQQPDGTLLRATSFYGGAIGVDRLVRPDFRIGGFVGGGTTRMATDLNSGNTDSDSIFGGLYGRYSIGASFLDFALFGGDTRNINVTRRINNNLLANGLETATATYNGWYVSPELTYGVRLPLWTDYTLTPLVRLRYVAGIYDGFTESGSSANLTMAGRTIQDLEQRGELKLTRTITFTPKDILLASVNVGVLGIERLGDTTINMVLLGVGLPFVTPGKNTVVGAFGGLGMEWRTRSGVSFFGAAEYTFMSDQANLVVGRGGIRVTF
jgi:uncharacterized protein with beta-barrel porin domain